MADPRGNPTISFRIGRADRLALATLCELDGVDVSTFANMALSKAISARLRKLGKSVSVGVSLSD
jgi:hypothetical protein